MTTPATGGVGKRASLACAAVVTDPVVVIDVVVAAAVLVTAVDDPVEFAAGAAAVLATVASRHSTRRKHLLHQSECAVCRSRGSSCLWTVRVLYAEGASPKATRHALRGERSR